MLVAERESADFFETVLAKLADKARDGKLAANWVINELFGRLNKEGVEIARVAGFGRAAWPRSSI